MAWEVIIPIAANIIQGMLAGGMNARSASRENLRQSEIAQMRREELRPIIERLRKARDFFGAEENLVRDFSRAADQMAAQSAQTGMTNAGSGGLDRNRADLLGAMIAELAQFKDQDQLQREQLLAQLVGDPSLYADAGPAINVGTDTFWGGLAGGAAGAGSALNAFLSTPEGLEALGALFSPSSADTTVADDKVYTTKFTPAPSRQPRRDTSNHPYTYANRSQRTAGVGSSPAIYGGGGSGTGAYYNLPE